MGTKLYFYFYCLEVLSLIRVDGDKSWQRANLNVPNRT
jgi:hypothetical protein